ncbi:MAG: ribbon-helix-helix protein, CopG family [Candidatus Nezhaarchaeales archaeon]
MAIISVALPDSLLAELDKIVEGEGFTGRSEAVRVSLKEFIAKRRWLSDLKGPFLATLMFTYAKERMRGEDLEAMKHSFDDVVVTEIHTHLEEGHCLEVLVIKGRGERIRELVRRLTTFKGVGQVELTVIPLRLQSA